MGSRLTGWRRYVAGFGFVAAVAFLASQTCKSESASADIVFRVGRGATSLERLDAELHRDGDREPVGFFRREFERGRGSPAVAGRWPLRADGGSYRLVIDLGSAAGVTRVERAVEISDGAVITVDLGDDLPDAPAPSGR